MRFSKISLYVSSLCVLVSLQTLQAQQVGTGGTGTTGGTAIGGTGGAGAIGATGGAGQIGAPTATGAGGAMTAEAAFSSVERGATVGATGQTGTGFSELSAANQGGGAGGLGGFRGLGGGGLGGLGGLSSLFGGLNSQQQSTKPAIRTRLRSAVLYEPHPPERVERRVGQQFRSLSQPALRGVQVTMEGRKGILTGVVESERHHRMSEMLLRLEPGVSEVDNQLRIASP